MKLELSDFVETTIQVVKRDGAVRFTGTPVGCFEFILRDQGQSVSWAIRNAGYSVDDAVSLTEEQVLNALMSDPAARIHVKYDKIPTNMNGQHYGYLLDGRKVDFSMSAALLDRATMTGSVRHKYARVIKDPAKTEAEN